MIVEMLHVKCFFLWLAWASQVVLLVKSSPANAGKCKRYSFDP